MMKLTKREMIRQLIEYYETEKREPCLFLDGISAYHFGDNRCPIGYFIPDEIYQSTMEGWIITNLLKWYPELRKIFQGIEIRFLEHLQLLHDSYVSVANSMKFSKYMIYRLENMLLKITEKDEYTPGYF